MREASSRSTCDSPLSTCAPYHLATLLAGLINLAAITFGVALLAVSGLSREVTSMLQLVELPTTALKASVGGLIVLDAAACIGWEALLRAVFGVGIPVAAA